jgi:sugar/nucleoside kinase (ribokinase family)
LRSEGDVRRACEFATVVNALYLTKGGGFAAYPTMDEIRRFVARNEIDLRFEE